MSRLIRVDDHLLSILGTRTEDGRKLSYEWGEPVDWVEPNGPYSSPEPVYVPIVTATDDGSRYCGCPK